VTLTLTLNIRQKAEVIQNHENANVRDIGQGEPQHRKDGNGGTCNTFGGNKWLEALVGLGTPRHGCWDNIYRKKSDVNMWRV
jgi:hypothetical protein